MANFRFHKISKTKKIRHICKIYKNAPFIVFLHGFMSDLEGKKPEAFLKFARKNKMKSSHYELIFFKLERSFKTESTSFFSAANS